MAILTDYGVSDNYNGTLEGVIKKINPDIDITYITPNAKNFNIFTGAYLLNTSYRYFKKNTIFLIIVDPGVGTQRNAILVKTNNYYFVAPDNGVLYPTIIEDNIEKIILISNKKFYLSKSISNTFHGRDIFAPIASYISVGVDLSVFGEEISKSEIVKLDFSYTLDRINENRVKACGKIVYIDHFGNIATTIRNVKLRTEQKALVSLRDKQLELRVVRTFAEGKENELVLYSNGYGFIEIGINMSSASNILGVKEGEDVCIEAYIQEDSNHST
ncbi:hypothetical protein SUSAZ_03240 [Sulfolobus acidocaldarius SUSAZ]|nr:hypothetical protein SUSAZ_03240 [Sulfolobus acidocaldarius SUSAZ]